MGLARHCLVLALVLAPAAAMAETDIVATCYETCSDSTQSIRNIKPASLAPPTRPISC
jgi:hypothetical protein